MEDIIHDIGEDNFH